MRARYFIPFTRKVVILDHWGIPLQGGTCFVREQDGLATGLEIVFEKQPLSLAPRFEEDASGTKTLVAKDLNLGFLRIQLEDAMAFLWCQFNVGLDWDLAESAYEPEDESEEGKIQVYRFAAGTHVPQIALPFDILARAIICSEGQRGPRFEATLIATAREALHEKRYIDSFRYSFLLFESLYGDGEFRSEKLKAAFKSDPDFCGAVDRALKGFRPAEGKKQSEIADLIRPSPDIDKLIDHLVDKRGLYFHGNLRRQNAWRAEKQDEAQDLAALSAGIALEIGMAAAGQMYAEEVEAKFLEQSKRAGAQIVYQVDFTYSMPGENFSRTGRIGFNAVGTKPTPQLSTGILRGFLGRFDDIAPMGALEAVRCTLRGSEETIFELKFAKAEGEASPDGSDDGGETSSS